MLVCEDLIAASHSANVLVSFIAASTGSVTAVSSLPSSSPGSSLSPPSPSLSLSPPSSVCASASPPFLPLFTSTTLGSTTSVPGSSTSAPSNTLSASFSSSPSPSSPQNGHRSISSPLSVISPHTGHSIQSSFFIPSSRSLNISRAFATNLAGSLRR